MAELQQLSACRPDSDHKLGDISLVSDHPCSSLKLVLLQHSNTDKYTAHSWQGEASSEDNDVHHVGD